MFDPDRMSEEERKLLEEVAKAKGQTLEEALIELGHIKPNQEDEVVTLEAESVTLESPIQVAQEPSEVVQSSTEIEVIPEVEPPPMAEEEPEQPEEDETDEAPMPSTVNHLCVQCGWDQSIPVIAEPEHKDKIAFLQAVIGQKVFSKRYTMFGNMLRVTFRTLTIKEIDSLYQETFRAQKEGIIVTTADYYEYLNRLRLYLQISSLSATSSALHLKLPEGLTEETHPGVKSYWDTFLKREDKFVEGKSLVQQISEYVVTEVLKTEHLQRTVTHECNKFNRLVAKLEACVDNSDFWKEIEQPS